MDYVFGLTLVLACLLKVVWPCDVPSVTVCFQGFDFTSVNDVQKACLELKEFEDCVKPYAESCVDNAVFAAHQNQMKLFQPSCKGFTSGSCDVMGLQKCMAEVESSQSESSGPRDTCKLYPRFEECVEPAIQGCDDSNLQFRNIQSSIDKFRQLCDAPGALGQECDEVAAVNCASTIPQPSSSGDGVDCKAYLAAAECLKPHQDSCKSNPNYKSVMDSMNTLQQLCGSYSSDNYYFAYKLMSITRINLFENLW